MKPINLIAAILSLLILISFHQSSYSQAPYWKLNGNLNVGSDAVTLGLNNNQIGTVAGNDVPLHLWTNGTQRIFINQNASSGAFGGYVGIGTGFLQNSVNEPLTRLHIGQPDPVYATNGWRPWMKEGLFIHKGSDIAYFGLMDTSIEDRQDAIIAWGDNSTDEASAFGPDFLRVIFNQKAGGTWANGWYGKEVMRFVPDSRIGMGTIFNPAVLPSAHVEINDNGSTPIIGTQPQLQLSFNHGTEFANFQVFSNGNLNVNPAGGGAFTKVGIGNGFSAVNNPGAKLDVLDVATQLRLTYSLIGSIKTDFFTNNLGYLSVLPSGSRTGINTNANPAANLEVKGSAAALEQLRLTNWTNNAINTRFTTNSSGYLLLDATGNRFGIETTTPGNTVEINSAVTDASGLRFTKLTSSSPATTGNSKVLSVDGNGDVVLVNDNGAGSLSFCSGSPTVNGGFHTLWSDWAGKQIC